ncbi:MAG: [Fe-Fe] hydrogenase large subunit C-terminal domain-containing protein, partial [Acetivibrio sp.]
ALPAPSLYGQFNNLDDINIILTALKRMGFDDVYEVSGAAELVSEMSRKYVEEHEEKWPIVSTACPSIIRLIRVRFPNLLDHLLPLQAPVDLAASVARQQAMEKTGLPSEQIGVIFISPCPAKVSAVRTPFGIDKSDIDAVLAIKEVYPVLLGHMKEAVKDIEDIAISGKIGIGWGTCGGEASGLLLDNYLAADGIENVIRVLEDLEDEKFSNLTFIELNACSAGCVGGVLTVENPYVAKVKIKRLIKYMPVAMNHLPKKEELHQAFAKINPFWTEEVEYEPVFKLGENLKESIEKMSQVEDLSKSFPGLDCGACGAPTCQALAEDIVRGVAKEKDCIYILKQRIHHLSDEFSQLE